LGHLDSEVYADRMIPLMILGSLMFIPGGYYMRIVYKTSRGVPGFSYEQIPSCY
jgi:Transmembrane proteins 230/134